MVLVTKDHLSSMNHMYVFYGAYRTMVTITTCANCPKKFYHPTLNALHWSVVLWVMLSVGALWPTAGPSQTTSRLPFLDQVLKPDEEPVMPPEPMALTTDWWRFFEVDGDVLNERIQTVNQRLNTLLAELPASAADTARPLIDRIRNNLILLPRAKMQPATETPVPPVYRNHYKLSELLDIVQKLREAQSEWQMARDDAAAVERTVRAMKNRIDTQMAAYLGLDANHPDRLMRGLDIMIERSAAAIAEERLRIRKANAQLKSTVVKQLSDEQATAITRLQVTEQERRFLEQEGVQAQTQWTQAQERLLNEQARALSLTEETAEDKATARYRQQRVIQAMVAEGTARLRLVRLQAEQQLVMLLLEEQKVDINNLQSKLLEWDQSIADLRRQIELWSTDSRRERERASEAIVAAASATSDTTVNSTVKLINEDRLNLAQATLLSVQRLDSDLVLTEFVVRLLNEQLVYRAGQWRNWLARAQYAIMQLNQQAIQLASRSLFKIGDTPVTTLGILRIILILTLAWWISYWLRQVLKRFGNRGDGANVSALYTIGRLSHYLIVLLGFIIGLSSIGISFANFALVAGALSIGIGFGLQSIVNNFVSGLIILFERSLKVGDFVELASGIAGEVREINVRSTVITTNDNVDIVVPNSEFVNFKLINWTMLEAYRRIHIPFKVAYGVDKELVKKAGLEAAERLPHTLYGLPNRGPGVWLISFGENCLNFELVVWVTPQAVKRPAAVHAAYMWEIETALRKYAIEIPIPQRDLRLRSGFEEFAAALKTPAVPSELTATTATRSTPPSSNSSLTVANPILEKS